MFRFKVTRKLKTVAHRLHDWAKKGTYKSRTGLFPADIYVPSFVRVQFIVDPHTPTPYYRAISYSVPLSGSDLSEEYTLFISLDNISDPDLKERLEETIEVMTLVKVFHDLRTDFRAFHLASGEDREAELDKLLLPFINSSSEKARNEVKALYLKAYRD